MVKLSRVDAKKLQLHCQGLRSSAPFGNGKSAVMKALRQIGYVQIDTISVVQRAHHHILWSRVPDYQPTWLHELQAVDKQVLEYWSHAAAYLPIEDFRFCLPRMIRYREGEKHWWEKDKKMMKIVLDRIRKNGPMLARDFENTMGKKVGPWFERTPAKKALEYLFHEGRLVVSERRGFQKVYEIAERYLPDDLDVSVPSEKEFLRHLIFNSLKANGVCSAKEIAYLRKGLASKVSHELGVLRKEGVVTRVEVKGLNDELFADSKIMSKFDFSSQAQDFVHILSPFDNLVIQRARLKKLFDFDYQIECYVPEAKRKFGYFCLPILWGDDFVGRIDAKADRKIKTLIVKSVHYEKHFKRTPAFRRALKEALQRFSEFNGCKTIES